MVVIYILSGLFVLFVLLQLGMSLKSRMQKGKEAPHLDGSYGKAIQDGRKALFYFYSPACGACRPMTPVIEKLQQQHPNVFKINVAHEMATARKFGIMATPSTVLVENNRIAEFLLGPQREDKLAALL